MAGNNGEPGAHGVEDEDGQATPPDSNRTTAATAEPDRIKTLESALSKQGRELAEAHRREQALAAQVADNQRQLQQLHATMTAAEERRMQAELDAIDDPTERLAREVQILKGKVAEAKTPPPPQRQQAPAGPTQQDIDAAGQKILAEVGKRFGVTLDLEQYRDSLDWRTPALFRESAAALAVEQKLQQQPSRQPGTVEEEEPPVAKQPANESVEDKAARDLGLASGPMAPTPRSRPRSGTPTTDEFNAVLTKYSPKTPREAREKLKELRDRAERAAGSRAG